MIVATAVIDRQALRHNLQQIRRLAPQSRIIAAIKANGYGHGLVQTANTLQEADCFGVARLDEALALRKAGISQSILLLEGFFCAAELPLLIQHNIDSVVHNIEQLEILEQARLTQPLRVWMKLDSGMHRLGVRLPEADDFYRLLSTNVNVQQPINILTHFSQADEPQPDITDRQIAVFDHFVAGKAGQFSLAASAGILRYPQAHRDWVRPGLILYGISPFADCYASDQGFKPVMTLKSSIIAIRKHCCNEPVGYGANWISQRDTYIGVIALGYGDGYPQRAPNGTPVLINGREVPLVGRVSMDMLTVDLGPDTKDHVGDEAILWGPMLPVEKIAAATHSLTYTLITQLTSRIKWQYLE